MSRLFALCLTLLTLLAGCGPIYDTQYSFVAPRTAEGRTCVSQCQQTRTFCRQSCTMEQQACRNDARQRAMIEYQSYVNRQISRKEPIKKSVSDFEYSSYCGSSSCEARCESDYRSCFADVCGGQVIARTVCTAFCDKAPPQQSAAPAAGGIALSPTPPAAVANSGAAQGGTLCRKGNRIEVLSEGEWYPAIVTGAPRSDGRCPIHYEGYGEEDDEEVSPRRMRPLG